MRKTIQNYLGNFGFCPDEIVSTPFCDYITIGNVLIQFYVPEYSTLLYYGKDYFDMIRRRVEHNKRQFLLLSNHDLHKRCHYQNLIDIVNFNYDDIPEEKFSISTESCKQYLHITISKEVLGNFNRLVTMRFDITNNTIDTMEFLSHINSKHFANIISLLKEKVAKTFTFKVTRGLEFNVIREFLVKENISYQAAVDDNTYYELKDFSLDHLDQEKAKEMIQRNDIGKIISLLPKILITV